MPPARRREAKPTSDVVGTSRCDVPDRALAGGTVATASIDAAEVIPAFPPARRADVPPRRERYLLVEAFDVTLAQRRGKFTA
jgi:hypothetical protein